MLFVAFSETDLFRTHDDTARLQLVNSSKNGVLGKILEITTAHDHPILINTSLNVNVFCLNVSQCFLVFLTKHVLNV